MKNRQWTITDLGNTESCLRPGVHRDQLGESCKESIIVV